MKETLIDIQDLCIQFQTSAGTVRAVDHVSFDIKKGEVFALVGESGCGKSTTAMGIMQLIKQPGRIAGGEIHFDGKDLLKLSADEMTEVRGKKIGIIFQNPLDSLNPVYTVGYQMTEGLLVDKMEKKEAYRLACDMLRDVKISDVEERMKAYPHELSGGQQQRVSIARAIMLQPALLVLDEPTSALDVSVQAQTLNELLKLQSDYNMTYLFITHNLSVVRYMSDRICVMYGGQIMEIGSTEQVYAHYQHPYTFGLMSSVPPLHPKFRNRKKNLLSGEMPSLVGDGKGCAFASRCKFCKEICKEQRPEMKTVGDDHFAACHFAGELTF